VSQTITRRRDRERKRSRSWPHLVLAVECDRPSAGPLRLSLDDVELVRIGRGKLRRVERRDGELFIEVPDHRMSTRHAELRRSLGRFVIEDLQSKNGVVINGQKLSRALLEDGDRFELGHTLFLFRAPSVDQPVSDIVDDTALPPEGMATLSPTLETELARLQLIARSDTSIVVHGESGTGKELIARAVHRLSGRSGPLVAVNCGALPKTLIESELFGHKRGAFSGALDDRPGLIRAADGGTLFLDEVGDLPAGAQVALLRALQEKEVLAIGAVKPVKVDLRVIAATHRDLDALVERGEFRHDLLARLSGFRLTLPPLRERREDLGRCIATLLKRLAGATAERVRFDPLAVAALFAHEWPQNVRGLEQCLAAALALTSAEERAIELDDLPAEVQRSLSPERLVDDGEPDPEREALEALLREHRGNVSAIARARGKARMQIQRWLKRYRLDPRSYRS
jgi:transcriptional regulator with GAF, ATPase, and Fis domain